MLDTKNFSISTGAFLVAKDGRRLLSISERMPALLRYLRERL